VASLHAFAGGLMGQTIPTAVAGQRSEILRYRGRVFVDFWNYELSMKAVEQGFLTDWRALGPALVQEAVKVVNPQAGSEYQGLNVYGSYDDRNPKDDGLKKWFHNTLDKFPGVQVSLVARQKKASGPKCPSCYGITEKCPHCSADMRGTEEKGVDVRIATDMVRLAWADNYDIAVLVSSDRDFIPVAEFLETKGIKVIHGAFPPKASELTQKCWGSLSLPMLRPLFQRQPAAARPVIRSVS
jgi:uncharacterized LabA/DUF88 family protein